MNNGLPAANNTLRHRTSGRGQFIRPGSSRLCADELLVQPRPRANRRALTYKATSNRQAQVLSSWSLAQQRGADRHPTDKWEFGRRASSGVRLLPAGARPFKIARYIIHLQWSAKPAGHRHRLHGAATATLSSFVRTPTAPPTTTANAQPR